MTNRPELKQIPLIEAIFEVRWALAQLAPEMRVDPHYRLLLGRFYDRVQKEYPAHEALPSAILPDDMVPQSPQHRFRRTPEGWPLIQMGPGLLTVNETAAYRWEDFRARCLTALATLWEAHPKPDDLHLEALTLRYINAVDFDHTTKPVFGFLRDRMGVGAGLPDSFFASGSVSSRAEAYSSRSTFRCTKPPGVVAIQFDTGVRNTQPILRWETMVVSPCEDRLKSPPDAPQTWIDQAHQVIDDCFFALVPQHLRLPTPT